MTSRELAIYTAGAAHQHQMYGESPYVVHLSAVDQVLEDATYTEDSAVRLAAWLHDVLEDTTLYTQEDLEKKFGPRVSDLVWRVSNESGENRKERAKKTYPKIAMEPEAVVLKLADRIANLEQSSRTFSRFGLMYVKEDEDFRKALYNEHNTDPKIDYLWARYFHAVAEIKMAFGL